MKPTPKILLLITFFTSLAYLDAGWEAAVMMAALFLLFWAVAKDEPFVLFFEDVLLLKTKKGRSFLLHQNAHKHAAYSFLGIFILIVIACFIPPFTILGVTIHLQIKTAPISMLCVMGGLLALVTNWGREQYYHHNGGRETDGSFIVPFSWLDVRCGMYFGVIAAPCAIAFVNLIW